MTCYGDVIRLSFPPGLVVLFACADAAALCTARALFWPALAASRAVEPRVAQERNLPRANKFTVHIMVAMAGHEAVCCLSILRALQVVNQNRRKDDDAPCLRQTTMAVHDTRTINPYDLTVPPLLPCLQSSTFAYPFTFNEDFGYPSRTRERRLIQLMQSDYSSCFVREVTEA
jgi:hypothetical protein